MNIGARSQLISPSIAGRYEVGEQIGAGGMATVHRAYDRLAQREVAYKRLTSTDERTRPRAVALFQREYDALARLPHPNIVEVYQFGKDAAGPYYTMELLTGRDLTSIAPLAYREACRVLRDVASALALVHSRRMLHRDISPNNVRLTSDGRAKLIDFGGLTPFGRPREIVGTPAFTAPECLEEVDLDQRSDLYSLGAMAYWALTKRLPVPARSMDELLERSTQPIAPPSTHVPELPKELDALIMSMLARDPVARSSSAAYVIDRLTAIADLEPESDERRVAFSYLAHPRLSGRTQAESTLEAAVASTVQGRGCNVVIEGSAGLGRSALLDSLALQAQLAGAIVLRGRGEESSGPFALARSLTQLVAASYPALPEAQEAHERFAALSKGGGRANASPVEIADRHALMINAAERALLAVAAQDPLVIVVDDLQLADGESLALLATLAQKVSSHPLALITSMLGGEGRAADPAIMKLREAAQTIHLHPLDEACTVELVEAVFGSVPNARRLAQWLHAQSGGVPGQALALARVLLGRGVVRYTLGTFTLPHDFDADMESVNLASAVLVRLSDLEDDARTIAQLLSLHDGALSPEILALASGSSPRDVLLSLEALHALDLVSVSGDAFAIAGSSTRAALKSTITSVERLQLHLRLGRALLARPGSDHEQRLAAAMHFIHGGADGEAAAIVDGMFIDTGEIAARWSRLLEAVLAVYRRERPKVDSLRLLVPLVGAGFYGDIAAQRKHIDEALSLMSRVSGMTLARKLRPYVGGKLAFALGLLYASMRRVVAGERKTLNPVPQMIGDFIGMVVAGAATAASCIDSAAAKRYTSWLEPLSALPESSSPYLMREYCLAIAETSAGDFTAASARYAKLIPVFAKPVKNLSDTLRRAIYLGALNGRAQAEVTSATPTTLELADELGRGDPFYAPHAECARMAYYAHRGDIQTAEVHRARAELLALQGGTSWSAVTVMTVRRAYGAMYARDPIILLQTIAELERLSSIAPKLRVIKQLSEAWLEALRGRLTHSIALYERVFEGEEAHGLATFRVDRSLFAAVLNEAGQHERARQICQDLIARHHDGQSVDMTLVLLQQQLAMATALRGEHEAAAAQLEQLIERITHLQNPLQLGLLHRDRARVALLARDRAAFDTHCAATETYLRSTRNAGLIQLADALASAAVAAGVRPPSSKSSDADFDGFSDLDTTDTSTALEPRRQREG